MCVLIVLLKYVELFFIVNVWEEWGMLADLYHLLRENEELILIAVTLGMTGIMMVIDYFWNGRK